MSMHEPQATASLQLKRWPVALFVGLLTGIAGAFLAAPVSDWAMEVHHVSAMEGGRACAVVAIWMPIAFIAGFSIGFIVSLNLRRIGFAGWALKQGISLVAIVALVLGVGGFAWAAADHPPLIDGEALALDLEVRVPTKGRSIEELQAQEFDVALVVSTSDRSYSDLRWSEVTRTDEFITVPASARLNSRKTGREITAGVKDESRQILDVSLPASPKQITDGWSEWVPPRRRFDSSKPAPADQYLVRYRVRFRTEYSPTPRPSVKQEAAISDDPAAAEEEPTAEPSPDP